MRNTLVSAAEDFLVFLFVFSLFLVYCLMIERRLKNNDSGNF